MGVAKTIQALVTLEVTGSFPAVTASAGGSNAGTSALLVQQRYEVEPAPDEADRTTNDGAKTGPGDCGRTAEQEDGD